MRIDEETMTIIIQYAEDWDYIDEFIEELSLNYMEQFK